jgi:quinol monooxygenase YgiN
MKLSTLAASPTCKKILPVARELGRPTILTIALLAASAATPACGSSSNGSGGTGGATSSTSSTGAGAGGGASTSSTASTGTATGGGGATSTSSTGTGGGGAAPVPAAAFFRGALAGTVAQSKAMSDPFFMGVEAQAMAAGDTGHDALLGTTDLGTTLDQFVGLDTWSSDANMDAVYSNPQVQAFAQSFYAAPPEFKTFFLTDFYQWGDTDSGDVATPHYFVMIRGRFNDTPDNIKPLHDPFAQGSESQAKMNGNVAHIVWSGRQDPHDALIVDIWTSDANIGSFYDDTSYRIGLGSLFDATGPNLGVYGSTDWVSW